jgi:hypothetical protein
VGTGAEFLALGEPDQKLRTALCCPVNNLEINPKTLTLIDADKDEKIRVNEFLETMKWVLTIVKYHH